jgi:hypothetical protein
MIRFLLLAPCYVVMVILAGLLAPILPIFSTQQDGWLDNESIWGRGPRLPKWLNVFMTPDNSLDGDATFEKLNGRSYWSKVKWLWRNPIYNFAIYYINTIENKSKVYGNNNIKDNDNAIAGWCFVTCAGLFQFTLVLPVWKGACIYWVAGWNIRGTVEQPPKENYQATYALFPRLSGFR